MTNLMMLVAVLACVVQLCSSVGGVFEIRLQSAVPSTGHVCVKEYQYSIVPDGRCILGRANTTLIPEQPRLLRIPFQGIWPENISLTVDAYDGTQVRVGEIAWRGSVAGGNDWRNESSRALQLQYRFVCQQSFYGAQCRTMCVPRSNLAGHYSCGPLGEKQCQPGWNGAECNEPVCEGGCGQGNCSAPGVCRCPFGFTGSSCQECMPHRDCVHGTCRDNKPGTCSCQKDWTGYYCDQDRHYCTRHSPCLNGGTCTNGRLSRRQKRTVEFTCTCANGFGGQNCEVNLIEHICDNNEVCYNGGKCIMGSNNSSMCQCVSGYRGPRCELDMAKSVKNEPCSASSCRYGGSCVVHGSQSVCLCAPCHSGSDCSVVDEMCVWRSANSTTNPVEAVATANVHTTLMFVLGVVALSLVMSCVLLGMCILYRRMSLLIKDPTTQNAVNERRGHAEQPKGNQVYKICVDADSLSCTEPPPPYSQSPSAFGSSQRQKMTSRDFSRPMAVYEQVQQYSTVVLPRMSPDTSKSDVVMV